MKPGSDGVLPAHQPNCFGCGQDNPAGLQMLMRSSDGCARAELVLDRRHEGAPGFAHGGAIAAALDDLFGGVLVILERPAVTASLTVDYRAPVLLGRTLTLAGWCERTEGRKLHLVGTIHDSGTLVAEARALFMEVDVAHFAKSGLPLPEGWQRWGQSESASAISGDGATTRQGRA